MKIHIINGPNLNLLGIREVDIYGKERFEEYFKTLQLQYKHITISYFQSNVEGEIINELQRVGFGIHGIILNAAGYSHTSIAIADTVAAINTKVVEVHISNIYSRESFREHSYIAAKSVGTICGLGLKGYELALNYFI
jgi:3-dehydroquinate dehydratase II